MKPIVASRDTVISIVKATICLHNFLQGSSERELYCPPSLADLVRRGELIREGDWRREIAKKHIAIRRIKGRFGSNNYTRYAMELREKLSRYFLGTGAVPWQVETINRGRIPGYVG